ncbi:MAG: gamma-glutamyl-gamma-aminobutyrate hydrolase family protein [Solirubrobacteraceae bacterium]
MRPLIAVTTSEIRPGHPATVTPQGEPPQPEMVLGLKYLTAIERAGGIPVVVPPLDHPAIEPMLDRVSGLCLSGGPDMHPVAYAERQHELLGPTWPELDEFELALTRAADERDLPILAICRGLQVLNVARGGTLHQHLPDVVGTGIGHRQLEPSHRATHWITLTGAGRLPRILRCRRTRVNSLHHQAVAQLGSGLLPTSHAADGTIESLEAEDRDFVVAVQWHAEALIDRPRHAALFGAFVQAASQPARYLERAA